MSNNWRDDTYSMVQLIQYDINNDTKYFEMVSKDGAQNHPIIDVGGQLHWEADPMVDRLVKSGALDLDKLMDNSDKNDPTIRDFYRKMGYSLYEYWEVFHCEANNPKNDEYNPTGDSIL